MTNQAYFSTRFSLDGAGVDFALAGNKSDKDYEFRPGSGLFAVRRLLIYIEDGAAVVVETALGAVAGGVTNGFDLVYGDGLAGDFAATRTLNPQVIKTNAELLKLGHTEQSLANSIVVIIDLASVGAEVVVNGDNDEAIRVNLDDDYSGLVDFQIVAEGVIKPL